MRKFMLGLGVLSVGTVVFYGLRVLKVMASMGNLLAIVTFVILAISGAYLIASRFIDAQEESLQQVITLPPEDIEVKGFTKDA